MQSLLDTLRRQSALLSSLRPPLTGEDPLAYVLGQIADLAGGTEIRAQLHAVQQAAAAYDALPPGAGGPALRHLYAAAALPDAAIPAAVALDLRLDCPANQVAQGVAGDLAQAAAILFRLSEHGPHNSALAAYRDAFLERYSQGREVPLLELLDEDLGLGPPPGYEHPARTVAWPPAEAPPSSARDHCLLELAATALRTGQTEVLLDEPLLRRLQAGDRWAEALPASLEIYATVAAASREAIERGDYLVLPTLIAHPAGVSFGRFLHLLGPETRAQVQHVIAAEEAAAPARLFAELVFLPAEGHIGNVELRPALRRYEVVVDAAPGVSADAVLPLDDLLVGVAGDRFYLRSRAREAEVVVRMTHVLNPRLAPNACRFLVEVSRDGVRPPAPFAWGAAEALPFLPRVRQGRIVLRPATWHPPLTLADPAAEDRDSAAWYRCVQEWRRVWAVPRYVYLIEYDNRLLLDLEHPLCLADLQEECRRAAQAGEPLTLQEMLPGFAEQWATGPDGHYQVELVVPFLRPAADPVPPPLPPPGPLPAAAARLRLPGSDWLYAKLYNAPAQHEAFIAGPLRAFLTEPALAQTDPAWFFVRYADPEPHLRLRFQGDPALLRHEVLPRLTAWGQTLLDADLIRKLVLDTYDREIERYGGEEGLALAEALFAVDSATVVQLLALRQAQSAALPPLDLALVSTDRLLQGLGLARPERAALYRAIRAGQEPHHTAALPELQQQFHHYRVTALPLIRDPEWLRARPQGERLSAIFEGQASLLQPLGQRLHELANGGRLTVRLPDFLASCVHMHYNRLLGTNRAHEFAVMYALERTFATFAHYDPPGLP